jgi:hypothetical protein
MEQEEFIGAVCFAVYKATIDGVVSLLVQPPGRNPRPVLAELSTWYNGLENYERNHVKDVVRLSVDQAVFGMLAALDGSRSLGRGVQMELRADGVNLTVDHDLHNLFRSQVDHELGYG